MQWAFHSFQGSVYGLFSRFRHLISQPSHFLCEQGRRPWKEPVTMHCLISPECTLGPVRASRFQECVGAYRNLLWLSYSPDAIFKCWAFLSPQTAPTPQAAVLLTFLASNTSLAGDFFEQLQVPWLLYCRGRRRGAGYVKTERGLTALPEIQ